MKTKKSIWERFLEFETKNNLFALQDSKGTFYWDILRFEIFPLILWRNLSPAPVEKITFRGILKKILAGLSFVRLLLSFSKQENLFYLASRNKVSGQVIDQNAKAVYDFFPSQSNLVLESYDFSTNLKSSYYLPQLFFRKISTKKNTVDLSFLMNLLREEFGILSFNESFLNQILHRYYADLRYFSWLLKRKKIKRVFLTQNGIQKGFIRSAKNLNIPIYEFQHGIVDVGHLAYNYPKIEYEKGQVTLPDIIISLSSFWFKEVNLPSVKIYPIGNDYFYKPLSNIRERVMEYEDGITVISSDVFGKELAEFLLECFKQKTLRKKIYFKLHPNQFNEKTYYQQMFAGFSQVKVITNEYSISYLLAKTDTLLAIQSTAIYEALQAGNKVILLKKSSYARQEHIFNQLNLHLVDNVDDFVVALKKEIVKEKLPVFFTPFNREAFKEIL